MKAKVAVICMRALGLDDSCLPEGTTFNEAMLPVRGHGCRGPDEAGGDAWKASRITLRANFTLVSTPPEPKDSPDAGLRIPKLLGAIALPSFLRDLMSDATPDPDEPDIPPPSTGRPRRPRHRKPQ